jgi:hypothetical protein
MLPSTSLTGVGRVTAPVAAPAETPASANNSAPASDVPAKTCENPRRLGGVRVMAASSRISNRRPAAWPDSEGSGVWMAESLPIQSR